MADILRECFGQFLKRYRDMGDGSHAEVIAAELTEGAAITAGIGAPADAEAAGNGSVIGILKRLRTLLGGTLSTRATQPTLTTVTALITNGQSLSAAADLSAVGTPVAIIMDAAWDTNVVTFQGSYDGVTYSNLRVNGAEVSLTGVVASSMEGLDPLSFLGCKYLKVRSGTAAAAVNQVGDTTVTIVCRPV